MRDLGDGVPDGLDVIPQSAVAALKPLSRAMHGAVLVSLLVVVVGASVLSAASPAAGALTAARWSGSTLPRATAAGSMLTLTPVLQKVISPPRWFEGADGRFHMKYELKLTNASPVSLAVSSVEVRSGRGRRIDTLWDPGWRRR